MDSPVTFILNGKEISTFSGPFTPLLDFLRQKMSLTGTKEGCREGDCGACTVLLGENLDSVTSYKAVNSCLVPLRMAHGKHIVTIEGIHMKALTPFQKALISEGAIQCGFCTSGLIMSMTGFLLSDKYLSLENAVSALAGNICRCTGYESIKRAVSSFLMESKISPEPGKMRLLSLIEGGLLPEYFMDVPEMLKNIPPRRDLEKGKEFISGGTDLMLQKKDEIPEVSFNVLRGNGKEKIKIENGFIVLNALMTVSEIMASEVLKSYLPEVRKYLKLFGSPQIRNLATIGGNIVNASPIADMVSIFLSLNSTLVIKNGNKTREIPLKDFYLGYKSLNKNAEETIIEVKFPIPKGNYFFSFEKVSRRRYLDIASVNSSLYMTTLDGIIKDIHISAGGTAPVPLYLKETSLFLIEKEITPEVIRDAALIAQSELSPISDIRGSKEYKSLLLRQLIFAHFMKFNPEIIDSPEILFI